MNISEFDYDLSKELIAQFPAQKRDDSRLLIVDRKKDSITHSSFKELERLFNPGDALVLNNAKVRPVRLIGKIGEREVDVLLVERLDKNQYLIKAKPGSKFKPDREVVFKDGKAKAVCRESELAKQQQMKLLEFNNSEDIETILDEIGDMPLPPYIKRKSKAEDNLRYQTVYASNPGAIAAPTAGLHFTNETLKSFKENSIDAIYLTLHVGLGTFTPVKTDNITQHKMHRESFELSSAAVGKIEKVKESGNRICAVGTTACRVLEACTKKENEKFNLKAGVGDTDIFIYPGYDFKAVDMMLTNFHLPRTTLMMLVCAFGGKELMLKAYAEAVKEKYRFYSYGDCMIII
ncbi:MAG: tRNA preQ1(34) S-adenosylmethionine ribosyltransferase-isomerase QueA [PVC group bacterium]|nr:tRNA preQ1(34) S-adenosylmethionine ribosyltransferase-isomerase QueA [PVC group bacterium]